MGQTDEQIDAYFVPMSVSEKRKKAADDAKERETEFAQMKKDIDFLKGEVQQLRGAVEMKRISNRSAGEGTTG